MTYNAPQNPLFQPLRIGRMTLPGRIIKTATTETMATEDGFVTDEHLAFYEDFAKAGTPLIITGNFYTQRSGRVYDKMQGADHDDKLPGMKRLVNVAHRHGAKICAQLSHAGRQIFQPATATDPVSASNVRDTSSGIKPREMRRDEIESFVRGFAEAAGRCQRAGFDAIQIHAAQGYLLSQFLTPHTNRRRDQYGGSLENRMRLLLEVVTAIRARVGDDYPILVKLNGDDALPLRKGLKVPEAVLIAKALEAQGVDAIEVSVGHYESGFSAVRGTFNRFFSTLLHEGVWREFPPLKYWGMRLSSGLLSAVANRLWPHREGFNLDFAAQFKAALDIPVICVGGFSDPEAMATAIDDEHCDAVSIARAMIADPYLVRHIREKRAGPKCRHCNACLAHIGSRALACFHPDVAPARSRMLEAEGRAEHGHAA